MAQPNGISDLQAVDFAVGGVIIGAYEGLVDERPAAFARFLAREPKDKIFRMENEDPAALLRRLAHYRGKGGNLPDLPIVAYYRAPGLVGNVNDKPTVLSVPCQAGQTIEISAIPVTLAYSFLWCAWDKPTLDKIVLAWFCYVAQPGRRHSRFFVPYLLDGEPVEAAASISAPREIQADNSSPDQAGGRLWAARALVEVNTQALYGRAVELPDELAVLGQARLVLENGWGGV